MTDIQARIVDYLDLGGFFNPEAMDHAKVRELIMDAADEIRRLRAQLLAAEGSGSLPVSGTDASAAGSHVHGDGNATAAESRADSTTDIRALFKYMWEERGDGGDFERTGWAVKIDAVLAASRTEREGPQSGVGLIAAERQRQMTVEGWTPAHDDTHDDGQMLSAAIAYAQRVRLPESFASTLPPMWPWASKWWKPSDDPIRNLAKAGALVAAEIDRLARLNYERTATDHAASSSAGAAAPRRETEDEAL